MMARQPFFNTNYQVASTANAANLIAQAGATQGQMFANLGKTIGSSIEKFREKKEEKEQKESRKNLFVKLYDEDPSNPMFSAFGVTNRDEAVVSAEAVADDPALGNFAISFYRNRMQMEGEKRAEDKRQAEQRFFDRILGETPSPRAGEITSEIQGLGQKIADLENLPEGSIPPPTGMFRRKIEELEKEREGLSEVPMFELTGSSFLEAYGKPQSPEESRLLAGEIMRREARQDANRGQGLDMFTKGLEIQSKVDTQKGNAFASKYKPSKDTFVFDESEAMGLITDAATQKGITLTPEQTKSAASKIRVLDPIKINESKRKFMSDKRLGQADEILESADYLRNFLKPNAQGKYNALTDTIAIEKLARMVQPTGILTDTDIARVSGNQGLHARFDRAFAKLKDGTLDEQSRTDLIEASQAFAKKASQVLRDGVDKGSKSIGKQFNIPADVVKERFFAEELRGVPADPKTAPPSNQAGATRMVTLQDGSEVEAQVVRTLPDGRILVRHQGVDYFIAQ